MTYLFEGQVVVRPQAVSVVNDSKLIEAGPPNPITVAVIGVATGGLPNTPTEYFNARDARADLISGALADAIDLVYQPNGETGAFRVLGVKLDGDPTDSNTLAVRASKALSDGSGTALTLTASDYGVLGNNTAVTIASGSETGQKITLSWRGNDVVGDNIGYKGIDVQYTGSGSVATIAVTSSQIATVCTGATGDNQTLLFTTYDTLQKLVDALNTTGKYTASVSGNNPTAASTTLDVLAATDVKTASVTLRCDLQAQMDWFNSLNGLIVTAVKGATGKKAANLSKTTLTGGVDATISNASWSAALAALAQENCQIVVPITGDATIHAMVKTHCETYSGILQKHERRAIVGGVAGETVTQAKGRALSLNSDRVQLVYPGLKVAQEGVVGLVTLPPYMVAAQKAGLSAGLGAGNSATYQYLSADGVERRLTEAEMNNLASSGVCAIEYVPARGYRIVRDLTTYLKDQRLSRVELSTGLAVDAVATRARASVEPFIGRAATPNLRSQCLSALARLFHDLEQEGLLVGDATSPAYRNLQVSIRADKVEIAAEVAVTVPANYFGIRLNAVIYAGVAAA